MKATLVPLYFKSGMDAEFTRHLALVKDLLAAEADVLPPAALGSRLPPADAAFFPQLIGDAFSQLGALKRVRLPVLVLTSDFGTVNMWDWEIVTFMKSQGMDVFTPYDVEHARVICRALALRREMRGVKFLVFQDRPGVGGEQPEIFRRFWWWEEGCAEDIRRAFGIRVVKKSFKALAESARGFGDDEARRALEGQAVPSEGVGERRLLSAAKMYLAVKRECDADPAVQGAGINCLNESAFSDTTPCLAWDMLYRERRLIWACEADLLSLLSTFILERTLQAPVLASNLYPFLMGGAALKHEKIDRFPDVPEPENHLLMVHCGYFGMLPRSFAASWTLRPRALAIVNENAVAVDGRVAQGPMTLAKLHPRLTDIQVIEGVVEGYAEYPGSDCRNGALLRVPDGRALMKGFYSHHYCLLTGRQRAGIEHVAAVLGIGVDAK